MATGFLIFTLDIHVNGISYFIELEGDNCTVWPYLAESCYKGAIDGLADAMPDVLTALLESGAIKRTS